MVERTRIGGVMLGRAEAVRLRAVLDDLVRGAMDFSSAADAPLCPVCSGVGRFDEEATEVGVYDASFEHAPGCELAEVLTWLT